MFKSCPDTLLKRFKSCSTRTNLILVVNLIYKFYIFYPTNTRLASKGRQEDVPHDFTSLQCDKYKDIYIKAMWYTTLLKNWVYSAAKGEQTSSHSLFKLQKYYGFLWEYNRYPTLPLILFHSFERVQWNYVSYAYDASTTCFSYNIM